MQPHIGDIFTHHVSKEAAANRAFASFRLEPAAPVAARPKGRPPKRAAADSDLDGAPGAPGAKAPVPPAARALAREEDGTWRP
jgi:hypothetical protein